jgi:hypothetical protein
MKRGALEVLLRLLSRSRTCCASRPPQSYGKRCIEFTDHSQQQSESSALEVSRVQKPITARNSNLST